VSIPTIVSNVQEKTEKDPGGRELKAKGTLKAIRVGCKIRDSYKKKY